MTTVTIPTAMSITVTTMTVIMTITIKTITTMTIIIVGRCLIAAAALLMLLSADGC